MSTVQFGDGQNSKHQHVVLLTNIFYLDLISIYLIEGKEM